MRMGQHSSADEYKHSTHVTPRVGAQAAKRHRTSEKLGGAASFVPLYIAFFLILVYNKTCN